MGKYKVLLKAFLTGDWYEKTETDNRGAAATVARHSYGRAYKIIDTETDTVIEEGAEDKSMKEVNGYPNKI